DVSCQSAPLDRSGSRLFRDGPGPGSRFRTQGTVWKAFFRTQRPPSPVERTPQSTSSFGGPALMNITIILFILLAILLLGALAWAIRPPKRKLVSVNDVLTALSEERHYSRLPQILQALRPEDTAFLRARGFAPLRRRIRSERGRIALLYLDCLQEEYEKLLEASRVVAAMAPELVALDEAERFKLNLRFALGCRYLRWKL